MVYLGGLVMKGGFGALLFFLGLTLGCGGDGDRVDLTGTEPGDVTTDTSQDIGAPDAKISSVSLTHLGTTEMVQGTHRPEIFTTAQGALLLAVVHPDGPSMTEGSIKHKAYHLNADLEIQGEGFALTTYTEAYGDPADHRVLLVDDEIVVVYQAIVLDPNAGPAGGGPAENNAISQSLMLARFSHDGTELFRGAIVDNITDFEEDNFPDHCMAWDGASLIVSTGSKDSAKVRVVDREGNIESTHSISIGPDSIGANIGNSLFWKEGGLHIASGGLMGPGVESVPLIFGELSSTFGLTILDTHYPDGEDAIFPTGTLVHGGVTYIAYSAHAIGSSPDIQIDPYEPRLAAFDGDWNLLLDTKISTEAGAGHVHPTVAVIEDTLYYAWSRKDPAGGPAPQVLIERYTIDTD
ncbi:MAG: hypothetical protein CMH54_05030 [Myxococcales bacterium]|nr:hypothetical protein [Myxococcales bacterium]|tara:strand:- start:420 stop:1643 length:1224 start_codon:yes stop_codon:yes gene_type:complete